MGFVQMCGWPFWRSNPRPRLVAAAVLDHEYCEDRPLYWTDMLVRRDDTAESLEDLFQRRIGWTTEHSHSGYNAPRRLLLRHFLRTRGHLFSQSLGPYTSPMGIIHAILDDEIDVGPVDGYFHLLLQSHRPELASELRTVAVTDLAPIPPFVASATISDNDLSELRGSAERAHLTPVGRRIMDDLLISRFEVPEVGSYETTETWNLEATANGYRAPA